MYEYEGLNNVLYTMLYGAAAMAAIIVGLYLLLRRHNAIMPQITSPKLLRQWAAAFLFATAASHIWWTVLGAVWLVDDRLLRNIINLTLDRLTFMPLMMVVLLRMLQDRKRKIWPIIVALAPLVGIAVWGIVNLCASAILYIMYALCGNTTAGCTTILPTCSIRKCGRVLCSSSAFCSSMVPIPCGSSLA